MNIKNRLYRHQYRSYNNIGTFRDTHPARNQQRLFQIELQNIQTSMEIMTTAFKNNIKIQQIYLDLIKAKGKKCSIKTKDIQKVYEILSQNKTDQIFFQKMYQKDQKQRKSREEQFFMTASLNNNKFKQIASSIHAKSNAKASANQSEGTQKYQKSNNRSSENAQGQQNELKSIQSQFVKLIISTYQRIYSRLIQAIVKKITYYILNKKILQKIILQAISEITKKFETLVRRLNDFKDSKFLFQVIRIIYQQNFIIESKIYQVMVNQGHVVSLQQFFRVNGILLEEAQSLKRNSRFSILSNNTFQRLSILSRQSYSNDQNQQNKAKDSKFLQNNQKLKKIKKEQNNSNIAFLEKVNKEIEAKYASALDKVGDLIANQQACAQQNQATNNKQLNNDEIIDSQNQEQAQNQDSTRQNSYQRWKEQNQRRKTILPRKTSNFQYFSSDFASIIKDLNEKKGKTVVVPIQETFNTTRKSKTMVNLTTQAQKINADTVSLQNPVNLARLLAKKFSQFSPNSSQFGFMGRIGNQKKQLVRSNQINNLLKIYQNNQKQNHVIDILFDSVYTDEENLSLQKNFIKLNILAKLKQKKSHQSNNYNNKNLPYDGQIMRQIEQEYQKLLGLRLKKKKSNSKSLQLNQEMLKNIQSNIFSSLNSKNKKAIIIQRDSSRQNQQSVPNENQKNDKQLSQQQNLTSVKFTKKNNKSIFFVQQKPKQNLQKINFKRLQRKTYNVKVQNIQSIVKKQFSKNEKLNLSTLNKVYGEFTNPLTNICGYYNHKGYSSLRNSLQKIQANTIKLKKKILKTNQFQIGSNVAFWNKLRGKQNNFNQNTKLNCKLLKLTDTQKIDYQKKLQRFPQSNAAGENADIPHYKILQKYSFRDPLQTEGCQIMKPKQRWGRNNCTEINNIKLKFNQKKNQANKQKISRSKITKSERKSLSKDFCLYPQKISEANQILTTQDLDVYIQKYIQKNNQLINNDASKLFDKNQKSHQYQSLLTTPRNSFKKHKQLYSTLRRVKVQ